MAQSEAMQTALMQLAIQTAMAAVLAMREVDAGTISVANMVNLGETHRHRHSGPALRQLSFNRNVPNKYVKL